MKVITEKSKNDIGKRLSAIYYIALHGFGEDIESNFKSTAKIIEHIYDIAYAIGGEHLADIEIPAYITRFNEYMEKKNERKMDDLISRAEAIKEIEGLVATMSVCLSHEECNGMRSMKERAIEAVKNLPSAESERKAPMSYKEQLSLDCDFCRQHECGDKLYESSDWDGGIGFDYIRDIRFCPICGRELYNGG